MWQPAHKQPNEKATKVITCHCYWNKLHSDLAVSKISIKTEQTLNQYQYCQTSHVKHHVFMIKLVYG